MTGEKGKPARRLFGLFGGKREKPDAADDEPIQEAEAAEAPPEPEEISGEDPQLNIQLASQSEIHKMYCRINGVPPLTGDATFDVSQFHMQGLAPNEETRALLKGLDPKASAMMSLWHAADAEPVDAEATVLVSGDKMRAYLFMFPPMFGGEHMSLERLEALFTEQGITNGIDKELLETVADSHAYMLLILAAQGTPVQDGQDGSIVDHFNRDTDIHLTVKWDNTIDYRDLGWLQVAEEGDTICTILLPTEGTDGADVYGKEVKAKNGRKAQVPKGGGTALNEGGTALVATIGGVLTFAQDRFRVDPMLVIEGNVDTAVGNLDVVGDVLIKGDVQEGFTVTATGNVTVEGGVEGAFVKAGGNVQIGLGMNGNSVGTLTAGKDVFSKFFENANVWAGGSITCDIIINSTIASEGEVLVSTGRGAIIGGQITALERVKALSIGNQSNRAMEITLGNTAAYLQEKKDLEAERLAVAKAIDELEKSIRFMDKQTDTPVKKQRMDEMKLQLKMRQMKLGKLEHAYGLILARQADIVKCRLQAEVVRPPLQVTMAGAVKNIRDNHYNVLMYYKDGEIHIANV